MKTRILTMLFLTVISFSSIFGMTSFIDIVENHLNLPVNVYVVYENASKNFNLNVPAKTTYYSGIDNEGRERKFYINSCKYIEIRIGEFDYTYLPKNISENLSIKIHEQGIVTILEGEVVELLEKNAIEIEESSDSEAYDKNLLNYKEIDRIDFNYFCGAELSQIIDLNRSYIPNSSWLNAFDFREFDFLSSLN